MLSGSATEAESVGNRDPQLGISKAGNIYPRSLLVECANHVLGPRGKDLDLTTVGPSIWHRAEANSLGTGPSLLLHASLLYCCIASGSRKSHMYRSMR